MLEDQDHYAILNCYPNSTVEDIKRAYHKLALLHHPDKSAESSIFPQIEQAYRILSNAESRKKYDNERRQNDLEDMSVLLFARISPKDLEECEDPESLGYSCRCGAQYRVKKLDLAETNCVLQIPCPQCTFSLQIET